MQLIAPDVLAEARGLSPFLSGLGVVVGCMVWLTGWHWHRFWVVVAVTLTGGLIGLQTGRASGGHILALGLLLSLSAGLLALELARVLAFFAAGTAVWMATSALFPRGQELWVGFLIGGLLGVLLYRFWMLMLTSFAGAMIVGHATCTLVASLTKSDAASFAVNHALVLNGAIMAATCLGIVVQSVWERWRLRRLQRFKKAADLENLQKEREKILSAVPKPSPPPSIWDRLLGKKAA